MKEQEFFEKYNIDKDKFHACGLKWSTLTAVRDDFASIEQELLTNVSHVMNIVSIHKKVHSTRMRIKDPLHLLEKIARKQIENHSRKIDVSNYKQEITDLMGVRALHLFKADWLEIDKYVREKWDLFDETPLAYVREGDDCKLRKLYESNGCLVKIHKYGYRSVHYILKIQIARENYLPCELQVRTIFEEGWSEIDHKLRYPYEIGNKILEQYLAILNRLAGNADDMGSFILFLMEDIQDNKNEKDSLRSSIKKLQQELDALKVKSEDRKHIQKELSAIEEIMTRNTSHAASLHTLNSSGILSAQTKEYYNFMSPRTCKQCGSPLPMSSMITDELCPSCHVSSLTQVAYRTCKQCGSPLPVSSMMTDELCPLCHVSSLTQVAYRTCKKCGSPLPLSSLLTEEHCPLCKLL